MLLTIFCFKFLQSNLHSARVGKHAHKELERYNSRFSHDFLDDNRKCKILLRSGVL